VRAEIVYVPGSSARPRSFPLKRTRLKPAWPRRLKWPTARQAGETSWTVKKTQAARGRKNVKVVARFLSPIHEREACRRLTLGRAECAFDCDEPEELSPEEELEEPEESEEPEEPVAAPADDPLSGAPTDGAETAGALVSTGAVATGAVSVGASGSGATTGGRLGVGVGVGIAGTGTGRGTGRGSAAAGPTSATPRIPTTKTPGLTSIYNSDRAKLGAGRRGLL
jgi:hypothetical protein